MARQIFTYFLIPALVIFSGATVRYIRNKIYKPEYEDNVQKPGKLERLIGKILVFLDILFVFFAVLGIVLNEIEMALVFGGLALFFLAIVILVKRARDTSYQENEEYFILKIRNNEYKVFYENIVDWQPSFNEIEVLDKTRPDKKYIRVNIKMFRPEILLRNIADMAFDGKFNQLNHIHPDDPGRKIETIYYLVSYQYGYLVEDYVGKISELDYK